jgi:hypothetical protein
LAVETQALKYTKSEKGTTVDARETKMSEQAPHILKCCMNHRTIAAHMQETNNRDDIHTHSLRKQQRHWQLHRSSPKHERSPPAQAHTKHNAPIQNFQPLAHTFLTLHDLRIFHAGDALRCGGGALPLFGGKRTVGVRVLSQPSTVVHAHVPPLAPHKAHCGGVVGHVRLHIRVRNDQFWYVPGLVCNLWILCGTIAAFQDVATGQ